jgi:hypothetical protein
MNFKQQFMVMMSYNNPGHVLTPKHTERWLNNLLDEAGDDKREFVVEHQSYDPRESARNLCSVVKELIKENKALNERLNNQFTNNEYRKIEEMIVGWIDTYDDFIRQPDGKLPNDDHLMGRYYDALRLRHKTEQLYLYMSEDSAGCTDCHTLFRVFRDFTECPHCTNEESLYLGQCQTLIEDGFCVKCEIRAQYQKEEK